jgi:hypothetical protein
MTTRRLSISALAALAGWLALVPRSQAAVFTRTFDDPPGRGFFEATAATPVGGNPGRTIGQQRANVLDRALEVFSRRLQSGQTIRVLANFNGDDLACTPAAAVLGGASSDHAVRYSGPPGSPHPTPGVLYHAALFDRLVDGDAAPALPDLVAAFNGRLGSPGCAEGMSWYHGFDGLGPSGSVDLFTVMLHELAHALGFSDFTDRTTGEFQTDSQGNPMPGVFALFLYDNVSKERWPDLTPAQRLASRQSFSNLLWDGPGTLKVSDRLYGSCTGGSEARMRMYAPTMFSPGSSISHWDTTCTPDVLMEPVFTGRGFLDLTPTLLADLGWEITGSCGDGVVDEGEQCDQGTGNGLGSSCSSVCLGAVAGVCGDRAIDPGEQCDQGTENGTPGSCCSTSCVPRVAATVCRASTGPCDLAEVCSGQAGTCPPETPSKLCPSPEPVDAGGLDASPDADVTSPPPPPDAPGADTLPPIDLAAPADGPQVVVVAPPAGACSCRLGDGGPAAPAPIWVLLAFAGLYACRRRGDARHPTPSAKRCRR